MRIAQYRRWISALGVREWIKFSLRRRFRKSANTVFLTRPPKVTHPLYLRHESSDIEVFRQIFIEQEYSPLCDLPDVKLVIDCGANVGYSSAYFLSHFPSCTVVAVEPDPANFAMLKRNLEVYQERVELLHAGIWSHTTPLVVSQDSFRDGREWTRQVRPAKPDEKADIEGVSIGALLSATSHERISILKMDIEGAEAIVFRDKVDWLDKVDVIAIELHDDSSFGNCSEIFFQAIEHQGFTTFRKGELTLCIRSTTGRTENRH